MVFELTILGCSSAIPTVGRSLPSQLLNVRGRYYLIDCGEGTQFRLRELKISISKLEAIFISHLHGDHVLGLPGLINSMNLLGRKKPLKVFGVPALSDYLKGVFEATQSHINFELSVITLEQDKYRKIFDNSVVEVHSFPLQHGVPTIGYKFVERSHLLNIRSEAIKEYSLDYNQIMAAKHGNNIKMKDGSFLDYSKVTLPPKKMRSFAYCSDTKYCEETVSYVEGVDILFHEATYMNDLHDKALERFHSTSVDAATIAKKAKVGKLVLGHYSARYGDLTNMLEEARSVFENTELALDNKTFEIEYEKRMS